MTSGGGGDFFARSFPGMTVGIAADLLTGIIAGMKSGGDTGAWRWDHDAPRGIVAQLVA